MDNVKRVSTINKLFSLFLFGGIIYYCIEIIWRGHSTFSMFVVGGLCFVLIGAINNYFPWHLGLVQQALISCVIVTVIEFISGLILNVWLGLGVWDYSRLPFNLMGQICLLYTVLWIPLSVFAIFLDDWLRHWLFGEDRPRYTLF
ncbi:MAG: putative ABC transporter permease [Oscillospiraceae bacterium]|jgi:uncharacterized membrane protein|nr:putative ABC transporter permease [Oscillospiraceae bacterium]